MSQGQPLDTLSDVETIVSTERHACMRDIENELDLEDGTLEWPGCYDISRWLRDVFTYQFGVAKKNVDIREVRLGEGGIFEHYVLVLDKNIIGTSTLIDASFNQFANEYNTPVNIGPKDEVRPIQIASPASEYVFFENIKSEL